MLRWLSPIVALGALTSCLGSNSTEAAPPTNSAPYSAISTELKDSSSAPAATVVVVRAHVTHAGAAIPGAAVAFTIAAGNGLLSADSSATDTLGVATVLWTLGNNPQLNALAIVSGDATDTLHLVAVVGSPSYLVPVSPAATDVAVGTPVSVQVRVTDRPGNPVAGATVFWQAPSGTLSSASTVTDATGVARVTFSSSQTGGFTVTAVLPEAATRDFQITVH
jgi:adhesin/invasin